MTGGRRRTKPDVVFTVGRTEQNLRSIRPTLHMWWDPRDLITSKFHSASLSDHGSLRLLSFLSERGRLLRAQSSGGSPGKAAATSPARARGGSGWGRSGAARWSGAERRGWADAARGRLPGGSSARGAAACSSGLAGGGGDLPGRSPPAAAPSSPGSGVFFFRPTAN